MIINKRIECAIENVNENFKINIDEWCETAKALFVNLMTQKEISDGCCLNGVDFEEIFFDITFTDSTETHELNRTYRDKDYPADIITFALFADDENAFVPDGVVTLGDIIIALDKVVEMAKEEEKTFEWELKFLIAHGILHLLGFDHQTEDEYNFVVRHQIEAIERDKI